MNTNESKATPRPWKVSASTRQPIIIDGSKTIAVIANSSVSNLVTNQEAESNAALIVRAVNLLEAHEAVAAAANVFCDAASKKDDSDFSEKDFSNAGKILTIKLAALAKLKEVEK